MYRQINTNVQSSYIDLISEDDSLTQYLVTAELSFRLRENHIYAHFKEYYFQKVLQIRHLMIEYLDSLL